MNETTRKENAPITLTFLSTGSVRARQSLKSQPMSNHSVLMRRLRSLTDCQWSEELPIGLFVIHHPDGPILFDKGDSPLWNTPGYHSILSVTKFVSHVTIGPEDGVLSQVRAHGIDPTTLQAIVLSHLHGDHTGGLKDLAEAAPRVPFYVSREHWEAFGEHQTYAKTQGCTPQHWPESFAPKMLQFEDCAVGPWKQSAKVTADGQILAVHTPGHIPGHISLVVFSHEHEGTSATPTTITYFLAADASYAIDLLDKEEPDGINDDPMTALQSIRMIKEFSRERDVVVLPSHDPNTPRLLRDRVVYKPAP